MGGWSMGWAVDDPHQSIHDDGRTLRPIPEDEYEIFGGISEMPALVPPYGSRQVLLYHDQKFIPETVYIRPDRVLVTEWESIYSSAFTLNRAPFSAATFSPIVDDRLKIVGHVGWADGNDIIVPEHTIRKNRLFWSILQMVRLSEERQRLLDDDARWDRARPFPDSPLSRPTRSAPKDPRRWSGPEICVPRPHNISLDRRSDEAHRGPLKDKSTEETYRIDLDLFVKGGGKAFVGRHFVQRGDASYLAPAPGVPDGRLDSPKKPLSSGYEFLVLVDPEGHLQRVMGVRKNLGSHAEMMMFSLELALTLSIFLDIVPITVVLLAAGVRIAMRVMIQALRSIIDREAKEIVELTFEEFSRAELAAIKGGGVVPKEAAEGLALEEVAIDAETRARWEARGKRLHLGEPGRETEGVGELWREGAEAPEQYWAKSKAKNEKLTLPKTPEQIAAEAEAAEALGKTPKKKAKPTEAGPTKFEPTTHVMEPKPIEGPNKGIPEHMPDADPATKRDWLRSPEGNKWVQTQRVEGPESPHPGARAHDAERHMFGRLETLTTQETKGEFHFMMDHPTCPACKNLQFEFTKTRPKIKLIQHNPENKFFPPRPKAPSGPEGPQ